MTVDPRHLANLLAIATHGSFNRAATALNFSQPALSKSIAQLERRLGTRVVERTPRGSTLTPAGEILVRRARSLESLLSDAAQEVRLNAAGIDGPLRLGATPSVMLDLMPRVMVELLRPGAACSITLVEALDDELLAQLQSGAIDLMIGPVGELHPISSSIIEEILVEDPFSIGVSPTHPLSGRTEVSLDELAKGAWVLPLAGSVYYRQVESLFMAAGVAWPSNYVGTNSLALSERIVLETDRMMTMTGLQAMTPGGQQLRQIPLRDALSRKIGIRRRRDLTMSPLARQVRALLHDMVPPTGRIGPRKTESYK